MTVSVRVSVDEETPEAAAEVLRLVARQLEEGYTSGFDRREAAFGYRYEVEEATP